MRIWKYLMFGSLAVLGAIGIAQGPNQVPVGIGAVGRGLAANQEGHRAEFNFEANKRLVQGQEVVRGRLELTVVNPDPNRVVKIKMAEARMLVVNGNVCEFSGPGMIHIRTPEGWRDFPGRVSARVADNRPPIAEGEQVNLGDNLDAIHVRFDRPNVAQPFQYGGKVVRGDIKVHRLQPPTQ